MEQEESFQIKVILKESDIKEAIKDYLAKHDYDVEDYNYTIHVRTEEQEMGWLMKKRLRHYFHSATVNVTKMPAQKKPVALKAISKPVSQVQD